jgi:N-acetylglucosaminyl-diphospho-decaprenol L-rhamnosyltransferase
MLLRREVFATVGGMDEAYWMYSEETDWCYRIKQAGWRIVYLPTATVTHLGGASTSQRKPEMVAQLNKSKIRFFAKHYGLAKAEKLRWLVRSIYFIRALTGRWGLMLAPAAHKKQWQQRVHMAQLVRRACDEKPVKLL